MTTWWPYRWSRTKTFLTSRNWTKNHFHLNTSKVILLHWSPPWPPYQVVANQELPRLSVWPEDGMLTSDIPEVRNLSICELWLIHLILVSDEREPQINLHEAYKHVRTILFFIGYPRSRHSLLGSLLDAHPHIVVSDETLAFPRWRRNPKQWMNGSIYSFYDTLFRASKQSTMTGRRSRVFEGSVVNKDSNYGYSVPNQWQGNYDRYIQVGTFPAPQGYIRADHAMADQWEAPCRPPSPAAFKVKLRPTSGAPLKEQVLQCPFALWALNEYQPFSTKTVHILSPGAYMKLNHFSNRQVIGDKSGAFTAGAMLQDDAIDALHLLEKASNAKVKFVHVVRNPFDNLATMTLEHSTVRMRNGKHDSKVWSIGGGESGRGWQ